MAVRFKPFPPLVPMSELVKENAEFDIGEYALPGYSRSNIFALTNKFFKYAMARLALCVFDLPEMARLVRRYDMGVTMPDATPAAIASAIKALDRATIDRYRRNVRAAVRGLCWQIESERMLQAYCSAIGETATTRRGQRS
jgi:hypothetical protein